MPVFVSTRGLDKTFGLSRATVRRRAEKMLASLQLQDAELSVMLCDDPTIAELNQQYRSKKGPTDVLSFPLEGDPSDGEGRAPEPDMGAGGRVLGDVVISIPTAGRQAGSVGLRFEVTRLLAHGVLHLLGWDHQIVEDRKKMEKRTDELLHLASTAAEIEQDHGSRA
jgi:probable rRNA maturation factor